VNAPLPRPRQFAGRPAAPGIALGPIMEVATERASGEVASAARPATQLDDAITEAVRQLQELMARAGSEARKILEFQVEFLSDPVLLEPAHHAFSCGADVAAAWCAAIDAQIVEFDSSTDDYFRHRTADLRDMRARVLAILAGEDIAPVQLPAGAILLADDLAPSRFLATRWRADHAIVLRGGSPTAHVAMLARAHRVPMVVGVGNVSVRGGCTALVDGSDGTVVLEPDAEQVARFTSARVQIETSQADAAAAATRPALTRSGERVSVLLNVASLDEIDAIDPVICDGVGLVRTELLFAQGPPDEDTQLRFYQRILQWAGSKPVIVRTLDAGGDKPMRGVTIDGEANPFLGIRGVRLSLAAPDAFKVQLRALLRAAVAGNLRVMLPMITAAEEVERVRVLLDQAAAELTARRLPFSRPALGIMIEVPAAALALDAFDVDFASIGSNDLLQYTMAVARDNAALTPLANPRHPGFVFLLHAVVASAVRRKLPLSLCGDLAAQPEHIALLLSTGLRALSMPAAAVGAVKRAIAAWPPPETR
jgi:phosphotransferase system enzyme I (PtsI)